MEYNTSIAGCRIKNERILNNEKYRTNAHNDYNRIYNKEWSIIE